MSESEFKSLADLQRYNQQLAEKKAEDDPVVQKLRLAKRLTWVILLAAAFLFFYLIDKVGEALYVLWYDQ